MQLDNESAVNITGVYTVHYGGEVKKKTSQLSSNSISKFNSNNNVKSESKFSLKSEKLWIRYVTFFILGVLIWSLLWSIWGNEWGWNGQWFRLTAVVIVAWASGQALQAVSTLPPLLAALIVGIAARNFGILDMRLYTDIDNTLRKIYPVIILGKASLTWDVNYMKSNWLRVTALGVLPWCAEVVALAVCTHLLLDMPWIWGFLNGSIYASVSCAVVMPSVQRLCSGNRANDGETPHNWAQLVCTAGGTDTALSVGVYGLIHSAMFHNTNEVYRYAKAALTLFAGVVLGVAWGSLAKFTPHPQDYYVAELRVLFLLVGGLCANFLTSLVGWGGTGGVAVLACNATASAWWSSEARTSASWERNSSPAATAYRVLWSIFEPMLFAYTGTFFAIDSSISETMLVGFGILLICLTVRLAVTFLVCWDSTIKERIFICCAWTPKSIVEAVLCPLAINTLMLSSDTSHSEEMNYAEDIMRLTIQAILITTPIGFLLTHYLGPVLIDNTRKCRDDSKQ